MTQIVNRELNHKSHMFSELWLMTCEIACELGNKIVTLVYHLNAVPMPRLYQKMYFWTSYTSYQTKNDFFRKKIWHYFTAEPRT